MSAEQEYRKEPWNREKSDNYIIELENLVDKLLKFVEDIAYNDINDNDLHLGWVQEESWSLIKNYKNCIK